MKIKWLLSVPWTALVERGLFDRVLIVRGLEGDGKRSVEIK